MTSPCSTWPAQGRLGLSPKPTSSHIWRGRDGERSADSSFSAMQECKERIDQRGAAGRPLLILRVAQLPAPRALFSIIRTPLLPWRRTPGDILRLTMRLSDAGMRRRPTKLLYPNHRPPTWLNEDASTRSLEPIVRSAATVHPTRTQVRYIT
jgi:hypothetical protein